jgi:hypothetical protein
MHVQQILQNVQNCASNTDASRGHHLAEETYDRALNSFFKQNVMDIENETGCKFAIQKDLPEKGLMVVQFFGTKEQIESGKQLLREAQAHIQNGGGTHASEMPFGDDQPVVQNQNGHQMPMRNGQPPPIFVICNNNDKADVKDASAMLDSNMYMNGTTVRVPHIKNLPEPSSTWSQQSGRSSSRCSSRSSIHSSTSSVTTVGHSDGQSYSLSVPGLQFALRHKGTAPKVQRPPQYQLVNCLSSPTFKVTPSLGAFSPVAKSEVEYRTLWPGAVVSERTDTKEPAKEPITAEQHETCKKVVRMVKNAAVDNNWVIGFLKHVNSTGVDLEDLQHYLSQKVKATATYQMDR